ncbi:MAG: hypothetical protein RR891_05735 [Clostridium sp.]|uniref:hypothetical protein n=1 Tax=Clostridium sp. TaxID=1506 RepID=UPI0030376FDA
MDNNTLIETVNYKKNYFIALITLIIFALIQLFSSASYDINGNSPGVWILLSIVGIAAHREIWKEYILFLFPVLNYFLFKFFKIYIPNYIVIFLILAIVVICYAIKENSSKIKFKISLVIVIGALFFSTNYYLYSTRIIKDGNLEAEIKQSEKIKKPAFIPVTQSELNTIENIWISNVKNLNGIGNMNSLNKLFLDDENFIMDYKPLLQCKNLKHMSIWYGYLEKFSEIDTFENLEHLEIIFPKKGSLDDMSYFPDVKTLDIQTNNPISLLGLKNFPNVEHLSLSVSEISNFDGIESLTHLKELELSDRLIENYDKLLNIDTLEKIILYNPINANDEFINAANAKGIKTEVVPTYSSIY